MSVKFEFRKRAHETIDACGADWERIGQAISARLRGMPELQSANLLAAYCALAGEPVLTAFCQAWLASGKRLCLPRFDSSRGFYRMVLVGDWQSDLCPGKFGIMEPRSDLPEPEPELLRRNTVWLVPGLAFSLEGVRLGRGGGYYDRLLADVSGWKLGVAADCQLLPRLPREEHDVLMDCLVTEDRLLRLHNDKTPPSLT